MKQSKNKITISGSIKRNVATKVLVELFATFGIQLPSTEAGVNKLITHFGRELISLLSDNDIKNDFERIVREKIATGKIERDTDELLGDSLWSNEYLLRKDGVSWLRAKRRKDDDRQNFSHMHRKYERHDDFSLDAFRALAKAPYDPHMLITCTPILKDTFPLEILRALGITIEEADQYALTITQIEQLITAKGITRYGEEKDESLGDLPGLVFFVKRFNNEICLLKAKYSDHNKHWNYILQKLSFSRAEERYPHFVPEGYKLMLPFPMHENKLLADKHTQFTKKNNK